MKNLQDELDNRDRYLDFFAAAILCTLGIYHSILYFAHQAMPNPDFPAFVQTGREILSLHPPSSYKRAPVLGLLQIALSSLVGGKQSDLTAGWLLNAILHPFSIILIWLIGRQIVGRTAFWITIIASINPWLIQSLTDPVAETTLLFFVLLTFYCIFRRSKWGYCSASIATMVRYDAAALIAIAFLFDVIENKTFRLRLKAFIYAFAASVPLLLWLLGTALNFKHEGSTHYLREMGFGGTVAETFVKYLGPIWRVTFGPVFLPLLDTSVETADRLIKLSKITAASSFIFGTACGLYRRRLDIIALLVFMLSYLFVHAVHSAVYFRFCVPIYWIVLLVSFYGLQNFWQIIAENRVIVKKFVIAGLQALLLILSVTELIKLAQYLPQIAFFSERSVSVPYITAIVSAVFVIVKNLLYRSKYIWRDVVVFSVVCLIIVSNQIMLVQVIGDGQRDVEFKLLGEWFGEKALPNEKLGIYMFDVVRMFAPKSTAPNIVPLPKADDPSAFVEACHEEGITYVVWASREGLSNDHRAYRLLDLDKNIGFLQEPRDIGPYKFVTQIKSRHGYVNIFRLSPVYRREQGGIHRADDFARASGGVGFFGNCDIPAELFKWNVPDDRTGKNRLICCFSQEQLVR